MHLAEHKLNWEIIGREIWKKDKPNLKKEITIRVTIHMLFQEENTRIINVKMCQEDVEMAKELEIKVGEH